MTLPGATPGSPARFLPLAAVAAVFFMGLRPYHSYDVWHHIRCGWFALHNGPATTEPFTCVGRLFHLPWIQFEWLSQVIIYLAHTWLTTAGAILLKSLLYAVAFAMLARVCMLRGANGAATALAILAAAVAGAPRFAVRPEVFSYAIFGALLLTIEATRNGQLRLLWLTPVLFALWSNFHGAYVAGWVLLAIAAGAAWVGLWAHRLPETATFAKWTRWFRAAQPSPRLAAALTLAFVAAVAAVCVNPYGCRMLLVPLDLTTSAVVRQAINEWKPAGLDVWISPQNFFVPLLLVAVFARGRRLRLDEALTLAAFGLLSLTARRHIALLAFVTAPIVAAGFSPLLAPMLHRRRAGRALAAAVCVLALAASLMVLGFGPDPLAPLGLGLRYAGLGVEEGKYPVQTAEFLARKGPGGAIFNEYGDGNYYIWRLNQGADKDFARWLQSPPWLPFVDGRVDVFGERVMKTYSQVLNAGPGWTQALDKLNVNTIAVIWSQAPDMKSRAASPELLGALSADANWQTVYWDDARVVFVRRSAAAGLPALRVLPWSFNPAAYVQDRPWRQAMSDLAARLNLGEEFDCALARDMAAQLLQMRGGFQQAAAHLERACVLEPREPKW
ncbi:MAG TPA: hypothetical protein P5137_16875, partial [Candidatus Brocadiia bacterium]|nr:hypothetical protein [Candidatus Brocadiia bacterium]